MNSSIIQLLVLAGIALFLILRLRDVLGTREGFEKPVEQKNNDDKDDNRATRGQFEVIEGGPDNDIIDHVPEGSPAAQALSAMKKAEPEFNVSEFLSGARGAYEMILMSFEAGELAQIKSFLSEDVYSSFASVVEAREEKGLTVEAKFIGLRELKLVDASFDEITREGEVTIRFVGELNSVVRDKAGDIVEGSLKTVKAQKDVWTFARVMGSENPNWHLVATGG